MNTSRSLSQFKVYASNQVGKEDKQLKKLDSSLHKLGNNNDVDDPYTLLKPLSYALNLHSLWRLKVFKFPSRAFQLCSSSWCWSLF